MSRYSLSKPAQILSALLFSCFITALTASFALIPIQAYAQDYEQNRNITAGIYLRIPFGPTKRNDDRLKYGLRLNMSQQFSNSPRWIGASLFEGRQYINMDLMSLNFSEQGFRDLSFAGQQTLIYRNGILRAAKKEGEDGKEEEEEGGTSTFVWILATVGVVTAGAVAAVAIEYSGSCGNRDGRRASTPCK